MGETGSPLDADGGEMSVKREDNICMITFEDENWKEEAPEVFTVTDGAVPFYTADTWKYNEKNTFRSGEIGKLSTATVYSQNAPMDHEMNDTAKKQYNLLLDVIDLCAIYY